MAKYTIELRTIIEALAPEEHDINNQIKIAAPKIFDFDYPIFNEKYRVPLQENILRNYLYNEIGCETVAEWKYWLQAWFMTDFDKYNRLYEGAALFADKMLMSNATFDKHDQLSKSLSNRDNTTNNNSTNDLTESTDAAGTTKSNEDINSDGTNNTDILGKEKRNGSNDSKESSTSDTTTDIKGKEVTTGNELGTTTNNSTSTTNTTGNSTTGKTGSESTADHSTSNVEDLDRTKLTHKEQYDTSSEDIKETDTGNTLTTNDGNSTTTFANRNDSTDEKSNSTTTDESHGTDNKDRTSTLEYQNRQNLDNNVASRDTNATNQDVLEYEDRKNNVTTTNKTNSATQGESTNKSAHNSKAVNELIGKLNEVLDTSATSNYVAETYGWSVSRPPVDLMMDFANKYKTIDRLVINDLQDLFMLIY